MLIRECTASKPGLFTNRLFTFEERLNVILGRNNSGKSLLARAIVDLLHGPRPGVGLMDGSAWDSLYLEAVFSNSRGDFRFIRNGLRSLAIRRPGDEEKDIWARDFEGNGEGPAIEAALESLEGWKGLLEFYRLFEGASLSSLCYLPSPADTAHAVAERYADLQRVFVDDGAGFYRIYLSLAGQFGDEGPGKWVKGGIVQEVLNGESELRRLEKRMEIIDLEYSKHDKLIRERRDLEGSIKEKREEMGRLKRHREIGENVLARQQRLAEIEVSIGEREREAAEEERKKAEIENLTAKALDLFPQFREFNETQRGNLRKIQDLYRELRDANEELSRKMSGISSRKKIIKSVVLSMNIASLFAVIMVYGEILLRVEPGRKHLLITALMVFALAGVVFLLAYGIGTGRGRALADLALRVEDLEGRVEVLLRENNVKISEYRMETLYEFLLQYFEEYSEFTEMQMDVLKLSSALRGQEYLDRLKEELGELEAEKERLQTGVREDLALLGYGGEAGETAAVTLDHIFATEKAIEALARDIQEDEKVLERIAGEIKNTGFQSDEKQGLLERKGELVRSLKELNAHREMMEYLYGLFNEAVKARWKRQTEKLINRSSEIFHALTDKQYISRIDPAHFRALLEEGDIQGVHQNILHLQHLSLKLAMTDFLIDLDRPLPLIIDDPFLFMDDVRISRLREILDEISESRQVIVFTHISVPNQWGRVLEI